MKVKKFQPTLSLKPTQFAIGLLEVEYKVLRLQRMSKKRRRKAIARTKIPVVISPWGELCVTDHHHFLFACWHAGIQKVRIDVVKDLSQSKLSYTKFWEKLAASKQAYLFDQFGHGPREPLYLPMDVRGMSDDPYRSLAWMVRKEGGFENSTESFCEFRWADFFRKHRLLEKHGRKGFHPALRRAIRLARSHAAADLPGYVGTKKHVVEVETDALVKSKYVAPHQKKGALASVPREA